MPDGTGTSTSNEMFEQLWKTYPRRVGKGAAKRVWDRLEVTPDLFKKMCATLAWQRVSAQWLEAGGKFIPHLRTWLNQGRWDDEPVQIPQLSRRTLATLQAGQEWRDDD